MTNRFEEIEHEVLTERDEEPEIRSRDEEPAAETERLDELDEAFLKNPHLVEEGFRAADEIFSLWEERASVPVPERLRVLLGFKAFNDTVLRATELDLEPPVSGERGMRHFERLAEDELRAEDSPYLPTIGTEVEVPEKLPVRGNRSKLFQASQQLGIPNGWDEAWEFVVPYTYNSRSQSALIHELIRGGFISTEPTSEGPRKIYGAGDFSLHVNIGIPEDLNALAERFHLFHTLPPHSTDPRIFPESVTEENQRASWAFRVSVDTLTNAFTYAFTSPERLRKRKTRSRHSISDNATEKTKKPSRKIEHLFDESDDILRLEVRSLEVRDKTLYRMLSEIQNISAALFSCHRQEKDGGDEALGESWKTFQEKAWVILRQFGLQLDDLDKNPDASIAVLNRTPLQDEFRRLITATSSEIAGILRATEQKREAA